MKRPLSMALKLAAAAGGLAGLAFALGGSPAMQGEIVLKRPAGSIPVDRDGDVRLAVTRRQRHVLRVEPPSPPLPEPTQQPADGDGTQARAPLPLHRGQHVMAVQAGVRGQRGDRRGDQRVALAAPPFTRPVDVSPGPPAPLPAPGGAGTGSAWNAVAVFEFLAVARNGQTLPVEDFSVERMRDLRILVWWSVGGQHVQRLEVFSPDGTLYQRMANAFDADAARFEQPANQSYVAVETVLPVAGTWITDYSLLGTWTVNAYLDEGETPTASATFVVTP